MQDSLDTIFPIIVPRSYDERGTWPGLLVPLVHPELAVTWVWLDDGQTMRYLNTEESDAMAAAGIDFHAHALANLEASCATAFHTHEKVVDGVLEMAAFMNDDGLGTSRLLLGSRLRELFPEGFLIGVPERSCGVVVSARLGGAAMDGYVALVRRCHAEGNVPMLDGLHAPELFVIAP